MRDNLLIYRLDWLSILLFLSLAVGGWLNIYAAEYDPDTALSMFSINTSAGKQFLWILTSGCIATVIMLLDFRFYENFSFIIYGGILLLLVFVLLFGQEVAGSRSWFQLGAIKFQPSEFAKFGAALAMAKYFGVATKKTDEIKTQLIAFAIFFIPVALIVLQGDAGTAMVFASLILVLFREGMHPVILLAGLGFIILFLLTLLMSDQLIILYLSLIGGALLLIGLFRSKKKSVIVLVCTCVAVGFIRSVGFILTDVLKPHQQKRVMSLINPNADPLGIGWNVTQSKIAIGSGGLSGKGFLEGTQTKFDFVPKQTTDFIFSTLGEEQGWIGSILLIAAFSALFIRIIFLAERQKSTFARVYGYSVMAILFMHFTLNIAMTIGLFPVIGIPLPLFSYGGSSLWGFTILLFIFLKLDANRMHVLGRSNAA